MGSAWGGRRRSRAWPRRAWWAVAAVAMIAAAWLVWREVSVRGDADSVRRSVASGKFAEARGPLDRWLRARPNSAEAHYYKMRVAYALKRPREMSEGFERAMALGYPREALDRIRSILLASKGSYADAEPGLLRALRDAKGPDPEVAEALARVYFETYRLKEAVEAITRWILDAPNDPKPHMWLADIGLRTSAESSEVIEHYRAALKIDPELDKARLGLADALRSSHRANEAAPEYAKYMARQPKDPAGYVGAGRNALELGDEAEAGRLIDRALAIAPNDLAALREKGGLDLRRGDDPSALKHLDRAVALDPLDTETLYKRSLVLSRMGRVTEAKAEQERVSQLRRDLVRLEEIRNKLVNNPHNVQLRAEVARWMFDHGQEREGARWAENILATRPDHGDSNRLLAEFHERRGNKGLANFYRLKAASSPAVDPPNP